MIHHKHSIPLSSQIPTLFTQCIHPLRVSPPLAFHDFLSIDDPSFLAFVSRPVPALILAFPTSATDEEDKAREEEVREEYEDRAEDELVMWY